MHFNKLSSLNSSMFRGLLSLEKLRLGSNCINHIENDTFKAVIKLKQLVLSDNLLKEINDNIFAPLVSLQQLDLESNQLSYFGHHDDLVFSRLRQLRLDRNKFTEIPTAFWTLQLSEVKINLEDNPLHCSCRTRNDIEQLRHQCRQLQVSNIYCVEPLNIAMCEEQRNFALGMKVSLNYLEEVEHLHNVNDGDINTA